MTKNAHEMNENEVRQRIITLGFGGDERLFIAFYKKLQQGLPEGTGIVLRGSVVTNKRHEDDTPFDSQRVGSEPVARVVAEARWTSGEYASHIESRALWPRRSVW